MRRSRPSPSASPTRGCTPGRTGSPTWSAGSRSVRRWPVSEHSWCRRGRAHPRCRSRPAWTADCPPRPTARASSSWSTGRRARAVIRADPLRVIADRLPAAEVHLLEDGESPREVVRAALRRRRGRPRILGVCGGDGSVAAVAHEAVGAGLPLLVVPGGTFNHFARTAGAASVDLAIDALQRGEGVRADVAELAFGDERPVTVLNTASVGVYPDFVAVREQLEPRWGKWLAAVISASRVLRQSQPVTVVVNGRRASVWTLFVGVGRQRPRHRRTAAAAAARRRRARRPHPARGIAARAAASLAFGPRIERGAARAAIASPSHRVLHGRIDRRGGASAARPAAGIRPRRRSRHRSARRWPPPPYPAPGYRTTVRIVPAALDVYRPATDTAAGERPGSR